MARNGKKQKKQKKMFFLRFFDFFSLSAAGVRWRTSCSAPPRRKVS
jgi:hypothetical protein